MCKTLCHTDNQWFVKWLAVCDSFFAYGRFGNEEECWLCCRLDLLPALFIATKLLDVIELFDFAFSINLQSVYACLL